MKFFENIRRSFHKSIRHDSTILIYSLIISILLWFVVSVNIYPETPKTIPDVPITINLEGTTAGTEGLKVVSQSTDKVTVRIKGNRSQIGDLKADEVNAKAIIDNVTEPGEYELGVEVSSKNGISFAVESVTPSKVSVAFDVYSTIEVPVVAEAPNIAIEEGLYKGDLKCTPDSISITGPQTQLAKIDKCAAYVDQKLVLDKSQTIRTSVLNIYNSSGGLMDNSVFSMETQEFTVDVPVYMQKDLKLNYTFQNVPSYFDTSVLDFKLSTDKITVAAPKGSLTDQNNLNIGYINLSDVDLDSQFVFKINLPSNYKNLSNVSQVTTTLNSENLEKKQFTISGENFKIINSSDKKKFNIVTQSVTVEMVGPKEDIEKLTDKDIVVEIDLMDVAIQSDSFSETATVLCPNYKKVWAIGKYDIALEVDKTAS